MAFTLLVIGLSNELAAQPAHPDGPEEIESATPDEKQRAHELYVAGYAQLVQKNYVAALVLFESSLEEWNHPRTHHAVGFTHLQLGESVKAHEHFREAMRHGVEPLGEDAYAEVQAHLDQLEDVVARVVVTNPNPDARVTLDGEQILVGQGEAHVWALVGQRQVAASRPGEAWLDTITVAPRVVNRTDIPLFRPMTITVTERPITPDTWKPWALVGLGTAVALVGVPLQIRAQANLQEFDDQVEAQCPAPGGCDKTELMPLYERGRFQNRMAIATFAVGGAIMAAGFTLVVLNRPQTREVPRLTITPAMAQDGAMVLGTVRF